MTRGTIEKEQRMGDKGGKKDKHKKKQELIKKKEEKEKKAYEKNHKRPE